ncbi:hypothetical protein NKG05_00920 [Oerskovia sp. M15]
MSLTRKDAAYQGSLASPPADPVIAAVADGWARNYYSQEEGGSRPPPRSPTPSTCLSAGYAACWCRYAAWGSRSSNAGSGSPPTRPLPPERLMPVRAVPAPRPTSRSSTGEARSKAMNPNSTLWPQITAMVARADQDAQDEHGHGYALGLRHALSALKPYPAPVPVVVRAMDVFRLAETLTRTLAASTQREAACAKGWALRCLWPSPGPTTPLGSRRPGGPGRRDAAGSVGLAALVHFEVGPHRNPVTSTTKGAAA